MTTIKQYTVNIGNYDSIRKDIPCITNIDLFKSNPRNSRLPKILSHKYIKADISVYWDANHFLKPELDFEKTILETIEDYDIVAQKCSIGRDCVYQEIEAAKTRVSSHEEIELLTKQAEYYKSIGFPEHCKTLAGYQPLIRRHNKIIKEFNEAWWAEICRYSYRDQCSFPVILSQFPEIKVKWVNDFTQIVYRTQRHKIKSLI
jgi:hypothetical protein